MAQVINEISPAKWVKLIKERDNHAFTHLREVVSKHLEILGWDGFIVDEATQETMIEIMEHFDRPLQQMPRHFEAWAKAIGLYKAYEVYGREKDTPKPGKFRYILDRDIAIYIDSLSANYTQTQLGYRHDLSQQQISRIIQRVEDAIR